MKERTKPAIKEIYEYENDFVSVIRNRLGIALQHQRHEMIKAISEACKKFDCSPQEYLEKIKTCSENSPYLEHLVLFITIGETYFFRDKNQTNILKENILPALIQKKRNEKKLTLRIWSAGCSSGEEIYTIVMLLYDLLSDIEKWSLSLLGTDINTKVLHKAIEGHYREWSMRSIPDYYKNKFFTQKDNNYYLDAKIKNKANFFYLNLNENTYPSIYNGTIAQDLILCRNVLIYFDRESTTSIMKKLNDSLVQEGYLVLGASDPFNLMEIDKSFIYEKNAILRKRAPEDNKAEHVFIETITQAPIKQVPSKKVDSFRASSASSDLDSFQNKVIHFVNENNWQDAITYIDQYNKQNPPTSFSLTTKANALANIGKLMEAMVCCQESLILDPTNKLTYLTYALVLSELGQLKEAEEALRKSLFLDPLFAVAHFQLGLLLLRNKRKEAGLKSLHNTWLITHSHQPDEMVPASNGMTYGRLQDILKHEIELFEGEAITC